MDASLKILIVNNKETFTKTFVKAAAETNFMVKSVNCCDDALLVLDGYLPHIVICDLPLAQHKLFRTIRKKQPQCLINMLIENYDTKQIYTAMSFGINNYLVMPLEIASIRAYLKQCEYVVKKRLQNHTQNNVAESKKITFRTDNSLTNLPSMVDTLLSYANPCFQDWNLELRIGLEELIINAIEHGNLNISFAEKNAALLNGTFDELVSKRQQDSRYKDKSVSIEFHQEPEFDEWLIKDEGLGFDICEVPTIIGESEINCLHGRGIFLSRFQFDEIEYSENGTKVRIRRYVPIFS
ncbi:MAG: ATP-binding protein [Bacteroidales bacterium]|nr:ATP-binding protein [Bacteroidales bacterium]